MKVLVLGATGATGRLLGSQALAAATPCLPFSGPSPALQAGADLVGGDAGVLARELFL